MKDQTSVGRVAVTCITGLCPATRTLKRRSRSAFKLSGWLILTAFFFNASIRADETRAQLEQAEEAAFKQAAVLASPALVRIDTVGGLDVIGELVTSTAPTTGVIVSADGYIVSSAFNFIAKPASILVTLPDGTRVPAKQIATDRLRMITLLKVTAEKLPLPKVAPKSSIKVGQWSIALGRTYDSPQPNMSVGIVSAINRVWGKAIQTDAKVSPINYGGPLIDIEGRVMGLLAPLSPDAATETAGIEWYDSGIGFAVPLEDVYGVLERLKRGQDLRPGLAGFTFKSRDMFGAEAVLDRVRYDSPAWHAGLKPDDVLTQADGKPITRIAQIREALGTKLEGDVIEVVVKRGEAKNTLKLTLVGELVPYESAFLGILPARETGASQPGVGVRYVYAESPAQKSGLAVRDRIVKWNGSALSTGKQLADLVSRLRPGEEATVEILREKQAQTVKLKLSSVPNVVPTDIASVALPAKPDQPPAGLPKTGRFTAKLATHDREHWAYVPTDYSPQASYGLMVWLHPPRDVMEAALFDAWKVHCDQRGLILVGPKAANIGGWTGAEEQYVYDLTQHFQQTYAIDSQRIVLHSYSASGPFAAQVAFKHRELFRGLMLASSPLRQPPPDNEPDLRLQFHLVGGEKDPTLRFLKMTEKALLNLKYPTTLQVIPEGTSAYPRGENVTPMARWIDSLDRI